MLPYHNTVYGERNQDGGLNNCTGYGFKLNKSVFPQPSLCEAPNITNLDEINSSFFRSQGQIQASLSHVEHQSPINSSINLQNTSKITEAVTGDAKIRTVITNSTTNAKPKSFSPNKLPKLRNTDTETDANKRTMFTCEICQKHYCRKSTLKAHIKHHIGEKSFTCQVGFKIRVLLHLSIHDNCTC